MGFIDKVKNFFTRSSKKQVANIINRYYGGDWQYFVWNYANQIYNIPEVKCAIEKIADIFKMSTIFSLLLQISQASSMRFPIRRKLLHFVFLNPVLHVELGLISRSLLQLLA